MQDPAHRPSIYTKIKLLSFEAVVRQNLQRIVPGLALVLNASLCGSCAVAE